MGENCYQELEEGWPNSVTKFGTTDHRSHSTTVHLNQWGTMLLNYWCALKEFSFSSVYTVESGNHHKRHVGVCYTSSQMSAHFTNPCEVRMSGQIPLL